MFMSRIYGQHPDSLGELADVHRLTWPTSTMSVAIVTQPVPSHTTFFTNGSNWINGKLPFENIQPATVYILPARVLRKTEQAPSGEEIPSCRQFFWKSESATAVSLMASRRHASHLSLMASRRHASHLPWDICLLIISWMRRLYEVWDVESMGLTLA